MARSNFTRQNAFEMESKRFGAWALRRVTDPRSVI